MSAFQRQIVAAYMAGRVDFQTMLSILGGAQ